MPEKASKIKKKLKELGLSNGAVLAAWPPWWSAEAESSPSSLNELKFSLARKLGLSPRSLFDEGEATFLWDGDAKFKGLNAQTDAEKSALVSFGTSIGRILLHATPPSSYGPKAGVKASDLRAAILRAGAPYVRLGDLLGLCWSLGIPVIHLRVFPLTSKRMAAMAIRTGARYAILLGRDSVYPAPIAYYIAHELGHIFAEHLSENTAIVDLDMPDELHDRDEEERAADDFGLNLLTGRSRPIIQTTRPPRNSRELASAVIKARSLEKIEPGTLALCYGHQTGDWKLSQNALGHIYVEKKAAWKEVNLAARSQLVLEKLTSDNMNFLSSVMGLSSNAKRSN